MTEQFPPARAIVIAHRGASAVAPEHTIAAYDRAVEEGADYIELDLQRTSDGVLVVVHDVTLDRTASGAPLNCAGRVAEKTLAQLRSCDVGSWFNNYNPGLTRAEFASLRIPTLAEVVARYGSAVRLYIETKDPDSYPGIESEVVALLRQSSMKNGSTGLPRIFLQSFSEESLRRFHVLDPSLPLVQLLGAMTPAEMVAQLGNIRTYAAGIGPASSNVTAALIEAAHADCLLVHAYTVDDSAEMLSLLALGVDGIFTNRPALLRETVNRSRIRPAGTRTCVAFGR